jgi:hypothetical protein
MNSDTAPREGDDRARALNAGRKMRNSIRGVDDARCERDERSKNFSVYPRCFNPGAQARLHIGKKTRRPAKIEIRVLGNTYLFKERQRQMTFDVIVDAGCIIPARTAVDDEQMAVPEGRDETTSCSSKSVMLLYREPNGSTKRRETSLVRLPRSRTTWQAAASHRCRHSIKLRVSCQLRG